MKKALLITDLDNTLYDWVTFFSSAFGKMAEVLTKQLAVSTAQLLAEFKTIHQAYGNSEQPFAALELPSVERAYPGVSRTERARLLAPAFDAFADARNTQLKLYPGVQETLENFARAGVKVVGHTEAIGVNAAFRLRHLGIDKYFSRIYALEGRLLPHPNPEREGAQRSTDSLMASVPKSERKPNPRLLRDICEREGSNVSIACYVGDSLTRDVAMALEAGVTSVWARYGTQFAAAQWALLVQITHWTEEDVVREAELKKRNSGVRPDHTIDRFSDLAAIVL